MKNVYLAILAATLVLTLTSHARTHRVSAWKGEAIVWEFEQMPETTTVGYSPAIEGLPAGFAGRIGLARPIKFERTPNSGEFVAARDRVVWGADETAIAGGSPRLVVVEVKVPVDASAGTFRFKAAGDYVDFTVVDRVLPPTKEWKYYLDIWQHPWAVSRWEGVKPFSEAHYAAMRPLWETLAGCGQKVATTTLTKLPWNHQCFDGYDTMVRHIRGKNGMWTFDYSVFDGYVEFCRSCGIGPYIACYTMMPWKCIVYGETEVGEEIKIQANPGTKEFEDYWKPFIVDFVRHLKSKGWFEQTFIAMDERNPEDMRVVSQFIEKYGEGVKIAAAGNFDPSTMPDLTLQNYCSVIDTVTDDFLANNLDARRRKGYITTYYVCCVPYKPNTFMDSDPSEAFWCGFFPAAKGLDGFLRWAYNSWPYDPRHDASFGNWRAGDTFLVYQDGSPSIRLLELRNGIQAAEKFRILKEEGKMSAALNALAKKYDYYSARKDETDLRPLREETISTVNFAGN